MFSKLFNKQSSDSQECESAEFYFPVRAYQNDSQMSTALIDLSPRVISHYGIPSTASRLAFDPIQQLLAVGTLDGRIKVIGSDNIEGLLISTKEIPFKNLEFLQNQGFLISVSNENEIQVWDLERRCTASTLQWKSNITAFSVIQETNYVYLGDGCGSVSVLKYDIEERKLLLQQYSISAHSVSEATGIPLLNEHSVVGVLPQPCSYGNRVLFAYDNGVIVLWDVARDQLVLSRGWNDHQMTDRHVDNCANVRSYEEKDKMLDAEQGDKEIVCLCWASLDGSILAVGYVDGDILLWNLSSLPTTQNFKAAKPSNNVLKLQLSSANRRFPVIVLQWSASGVHNDQSGQLFVYGGDEIGSAEVLTILNLEWSSRRDALKNVTRANITLEGSYADMILRQSFNVVEDTGATSLFLLCSPGQLQYYDSTCLSGVISHQDKSCTAPVYYRSAVPTTEPYLTVGRLISVLGNTECSVALSEMASARELQGTYLPSDKSSMWPLNGGVPCHLSLQVQKIERLYIAGYQDGSIRMWDATYPMLLPIFILDHEARGVTIAGASGSVSALDFSSETLNIAIGNSSGTVCLYSLTRNCNETRLHVVTGTKSEVCDLDQGSGFYLSSVFALSSSPVCTLRYTNLGARVAVGYKSGQVAMLNTSSSSVLFLIDALPSSSPHVVSFSPEIFLDAPYLGTCLDELEPPEQSEPVKEFMFALRSDLHISVLDCSNGNVIGFVPKHHNEESTAISLYILEGTKCVTEVSGRRCVPFLSQEDKAKVEPAQISDSCEGNSDGVDRSTNFVQSSEDLQILLCCTDVLLLYSLKSVIQGHSDSIHEVHLLKTSCWTATFRNDEQESGLLVFYQTGSIEIRSLPNLEVLGELSLLTILRWNFKTNMDKTMSCTENGQIALVNGSEFVILSLLACENDFRIPQSLPCLHDKPLAAALDLTNSPNQKKNKEEAPSGILGGIMRGLRASKETQSTDSVDDQNTIQSALDKVFSRSPTEPSTAVKDDGKVMELNIDDIEIDGPLHISPIAHKSENEANDKSAERQKLFEGGTSETNPRQRTVEEIKAKYRKAGDTSSAVASAASEAKNKLLERQEKLERISQNSEELRHGAENFASMAKELAKRMESRKWWQL